MKTKKEEKKKQPEEKAKKGGKAGKQAVGGAAAGGMDWTGFSLPQKVRETEAHYVALALTEAGGSIKKASEMLGVSHQNLSIIVARKHPQLLSLKKQRKKRCDSGIPVAERNKAEK
jgi:DNA-binding NtrC family response regulator